MLTRPSRRPGVRVRHWDGFRSRAGFTTAELLVAATVGMMITGSALALCHVGNRAVAALIGSQAAWQEARAAATLWTGEWRGAGYDPTGAAGAGIGRATAESLEFSADWNANGTLVPTDTNPSERLAWAAAPGVWRRGVNGGPRLPAAWPDSARFIYRDAAGADLGGAPDPAAVRVVEARLFLVSPRGGRGTTAIWTAARRNSRVP